jgi:uncharacterized protein YycO
MKILFQKNPRTFYEKLICWWTRGPYFHCAILFTDTILFEAAPGIGVHMAIINYIDTNVWDFIDIPMSQEEEAEMQAWAVKELGCKYDWMSLIWSQILHIPREHPDKWFCSEFAVADLQVTKRLPSIKPCKENPNSLAKLLKKGN